MKFISAWAIWLIVAFVMVIIEILTFSFFMLWIGIGALAAFLIALFFPEQYILQILVAIGVSVILIFLVRPFIKENWQGKKGYQEPYEKIVGQIGEVLETIPSQGFGIVKVGTETWSAKATHEIKKGQLVQVISRQSTIIEVEKRKGV